jgi:hypothetical protein
MENKSSVNFHGFGYRAMQGVRLIVESMTFATPLVSIAAQTSWRHFEEKNLLDSRLREGAEHTLSKI